MRGASEFLSDESGLETVEWAIIGGMVVGVTVLLLTQLGSWVKGQYTNMKTEMGV